MARPDELRPCDITEIALILPGGDLQLTTVGRQNFVCPQDQQPGGGRIALLRLYPGAVRPVRDKVDERIIAEVKTRTGRIIDSQWEVRGWPVHRTARPFVDASMSISTARLPRRRNELTLEPNREPQPASSA